MAGPPQNISDNSDTELEEKDSRFGTVGGIIKDEAENFYGITCRHVTRIASDTFIYVRTNSNNLVRIGHTLCSHGDQHSDAFPQDIDIFAIDKQYFPLLRDLRKVTEAPAECVRVGLYKNDVVKLYGRKVTIHINTHSRDQAKRRQCRVSAETDAVTLATETSGIIASKQTHVDDFTKVFKTRGMDNRYNFAVACNGVLPSPGDSGSLVTLMEGHMMFLVGILTDGSCTTEGDIYYVIVTLLHSGLLMIEEIYETKFSLHTPSFIHVLCPPKYWTGKDYTATTHSVCIEVGSSAWIRVKTPEFIKPTDFVLYERIILLTKWVDSSSDLMRPDVLQKEIDVEIEVSRMLFAREDLKSGRSQCDTTNQKIYIFFMKGADHMYRHKFKKAQEMFKQALRYLTKTQFPCRLLCKLIHCETWYLLWKRNEKKLEELLTKSERFILEMETKPSPPVRNMAYFYVNYALFLNRKHNEQLRQCPRPGHSEQTNMIIHEQESLKMKALKMADRAFVFFEKYQLGHDHDVNWPGVALAHKAAIYLGCGEYFEYRELNISAADIHHAEECLEQIQRFNSEIPELRVHYHLAKADLFYRKRDFEKARRSAVPSKTLSEKNHLTDELKRAQCRLAILGE